MSTSPKNSHTALLSAEQSARLKSLLEERGWTFQEKEYCLYAAHKDKTNVAVYQKGPKVLIQGRGTSEFVEFILEPEILGQATLGYEEVHAPEMFQPHFGIDESGKGDLYGPLVISGVYVDPAITRHLMQNGVQDSKAIDSDKRIRDLAEIIRTTPGLQHDTVSIGPQRYNEVYEEAGNLNRLLAWGHARVIENLLGKQPDCPRALSDQFAANKTVLQREMLAKGRKITLEQRTKGESDIAVAAASILARERFINWLQDAGKRLGVKLPRGSSSPDVVKIGQQIVGDRGSSFFGQIAKLHFRTAYRVLGLPEPAKKEWRRK
jgi:ribonuclease HIII